MPSRSGQRNYRHTRHWRGPLRRTVLRRDGYRCVFCGAPGADAKGKGLTLAHYPHTHDELLAAGHDPNHPSRIVTACVRCHGHIDGGRSNGGRR